MASLQLPATLRLPHPYLTTYAVHEVSSTHAPTRYGTKLLQIRHEPRTSARTPTRQDAKQPPEQLHSNVSFSNPIQDQRDDQLPPASNNFFWGRVRRAPKSDLVWNEPQPPSIAQVWLIAYALFTLRPELEYFRVGLVGAGSNKVASELKAVTLAVQHPIPEHKSSSDPEAYPDELVFLRGNFWQGAGSPFGPRTVWAPETNQVAGRPLSEYPLNPLHMNATSRFPNTRVHAFHPTRPQKPAPGSVVYSRYIPHLDEHFSVIALDYNDPEHLGLFNQWQNDPFVAAGWNETGTLDQHRTYLKNLHEDPHTFTVLAKFDDTFFSYHELYWAKEDHAGVYMNADDYDRGRHSLVGDTRFRGKHRAAAWWPSLMHFCFLDDPRTSHAVGEPVTTGTPTLSYDMMSGLGMVKHIDLGHKRSAFMRVGRERFFQLCPFAFDGETKIGGTNIKLFAAKL